jgi:3-deoxy-7-phosphoheptulonate synthase
MLIVMSKSSSKKEIEDVVSVINKTGCEARLIPGGDRVAIGVLYNKSAVDEDLFITMPGVKEVIKVTKPYKLVSREFHPEDTKFKVNDVTIGSDEIVIIAGPCAVESSNQAITIAKLVKNAGANMFRAGAFKPRSSPYSFQGLGVEGLKILEMVREITGLPIITEALDTESFDSVEKCADIIQIGARNMQNFSLLKKAGKSVKPILLKRGIASTIDEWLMAAEYIMEGGNEKVILCERGVRTFATHSRNTLDISSIPAVMKESHLPVFADPSHAGGYRYQVVPLARSAVAAGCKGLLIEVHNAPDKALSDGAQSIYPDQFEVLCRQVKRIKEAINQ